MLAGHASVSGRTVRPFFFYRGVAKNSTVRRRLAWRQNDLSMLVYGPSAPGDRKVWRTQCGDRPHPRDHGASTNHKTQPAWRGHIKPGVVVCAIRLGIQDTRECNHIVAVAYIEIQVNEWSG